MKKILSLGVLAALLVACNGEKDGPSGSAERYYTLSLGSYATLTMRTSQTAPSTVPWVNGEKVFVASGTKSGSEADVSGGNVKAKVDASATNIYFIRGGKVALSGGAAVISPSLDGTASDAALAAGKVSPEGKNVTLEPIASLMKFSLITPEARQVTITTDEAVFPTKASYDLAWGQFKVTTKKKSVTVPVSGAGTFYLPLAPDITILSLSLEWKDAAGQVLGSKEGLLGWETAVGGAIDLGDLEFLVLGSASGIPLPDPSIPQSEKAVQAVAGMGVGMNLTGLEHCWESLMTKPQRGNPAYYETAGGYGLITATTMQAIADAGYKCVRVPVTWHLHMDNINATIDKVWLDRVEEVVNLALNAGLYVIINLHHDAGTIVGVWCISDLEHYETTSAGLVNIWTQVAERFKNHDYKLLFEGYNEMLDGDNTWTYPKKQSSMDVSNQLAQDFVTAVRRTGGKNSTRNLIVSTYATTATTRAVEAFQMPWDITAGHLFVQVHSYVPQDFCSQVATGRNNLIEGDFTSMEAVFEPLDRVFLSKGYPVILGEFGAFPREGRSEDDRATHAGYMTKLSLQHGVVPIIWYNPLNNAERSNGTWKYTNIRDAMINAYNEYTSGL